MKYSALDIRRYKKDGIVKLCKVSMGKKNHWVYENINEEYMYADHTSWIYFIVVNYTIFKLGETSRPLGIRRRDSIQPTSGSRCRMGRLASQPNRLSYDDTDAYIRSNLKKAVNDNRVSIWVRKCDIINTKTKLNNKPIMLKTSFHKDLEKHYLNNIYDELGKLPMLNKAKI